MISGLGKLEAFSFGCLVNPRDVPKPSFVAALIMTATGGDCCHTYIHVGTELSVLVLISFRYYYYYYCYYYSLSPIQGIYNYISEANHISGVYNFAAVLYLQFTQHVLFYIYNLQFTQHVLFFPVLNMFCVFYIITFRSMCAVPRTTVSLVPSFLAFLVLSE